MAATDFLIKEKDEQIQALVNALQISLAEPLPHPSKDTPQRPNPNTPPSSPWEPYKSPAPSRDDKLAHRSHEPSFTHDGIPRYGWGDDSHDPNQHRTPVDDYNNPIPSLTPTDEEIDSMNGLQISGNPFGYSNEYIERSKALREIILRGKWDNVNQKDKALRLLSDIPLKYINERRVR